jgi:lytic murein transglycosylase
MAFDAWRADFLSRAPAQWRAILERELRGVTPDARAITSDLGQPEFSRPISQYVAGAASAVRVANGRTAMAGVPELGAIEQRYGVPREVLVAIWGMESAYGQIKGDKDVFRSLATLAAQGRRRGWAEEQLIASARMIGEGYATRAQMRGSWAGAMGHTQFIPATYLTHAQDGDGDGDKDIWNSPADALASAAQLLRASGWRPGVSWHQEVILPGQFDYSLSETQAMTPSAWAERGVRPATGAWSGADASAEARLLLPSGARGPAFLAFPNHFAIRGYNNSISYALGIGMLADALRGAPPLRTAWPQETALSLADRRAAQAALAQLGYDPGGIDGVIGSGTRAALRRWQQARNRPADGYLDADTIAALRREAGL